MKKLIFQDLTPLLVQMKKLIFQDLTPLLPLLVPPLLVRTVSHIISMIDPFARTTTKNGRSKWVA